MDYSLEFDPVNKFLKARFHGILTDQVLQTYYARSGEYVARNSARAAITDLSEITSIQISPATVRSMAAQAPAVTQPGFVRIIVAPSSFAFGLSRMFQILGDDTRPNFHVVRSLGEAWLLLGVVEPHFEPIDGK